MFCSFRNSSRELAVKIRGEMRRGGRKDLRVQRKKGSENSFGWGKRRSHRTRGFKKEGNRDGESRQRGTDRRIGLLDKQKKEEVSSHLVKEREWN